MNKRLRHTEVHWFSYLRWQWERRFQEKVDPVDDIRMVWYKRRLPSPCPCPALQFSWVPLTFGKTQNLFLFEISASPKPKTWSYLKIHFLQDLKLGNWARSNTSPISAKPKSVPIQITPKLNPIWRKRCHICIRCQNHGTSLFFSWILILPSKIRTSVFCDENDAKGGDFWRKSSLIF